MDLIVHLSEARVQRVKSSPEKQMDAMPIKNTNSAVIARRALYDLAPSAYRTWKKDSRRHTELQRYWRPRRMQAWPGVVSRHQNKIGLLSDLGKRIQAPQARMSKPRSEADPILNNDLTAWGGLPKEGARYNLLSPDERPFHRRTKYNAVTVIKAASKTFHI